MPTGTFHYSDDAERLAIEAAISFVAEMRQLAQTAPAGQVISLCEGQALDQGRSLLRSTLRNAVQARIDSVEQKGGAARSCACAGPLRYKRRDCHRDLMTALGILDLRRSHGYCTKCDLPYFAADSLLGIDSFMTVRAKSMACLAGINDPFRKADTLLTALAGWHVCAETIRRCCHEGATDARERRHELNGLPEKFEQAQGQDREAHIDAGKVNTPDGWRDIKLVVFACRERGESSTSADYEQRDLPAPSVRSVVAEVEEARAFGPRCKAEAERLGVVETCVQEAERSRTGDTWAQKIGRLSVLGDGAEWIWNLADQQFTGATQLLDVYHGVEKLADAGREEFGQGTGALEKWLDEARGKLVADGYDGVCEALMRPPAGKTEGVESGVGEDEQQPREMMGGEVTATVLNYFCGHQVRLGYAGRLHKGQVIGSGLVEGTIKQRVNVRMKRGSARWLAEHAGPFVELMAMADTVEWSEFWALMAL